MKKLILLVFLSVLFVGCKDNESITKTYWQTIYQDSTIRMTHIKFLERNTGFVLAGNTIAIDSLRGRQVILKTSDGGKTWIKYPCLFPTFNDVARMIVPLNANTLLAGSYFLYLSKDNGLNWNRINPTYKDLNIFDIYIKDSLNWILADGNDITLTTDAGNTFKKVLLTDFRLPFSHLEFPSKMVGYAYGGASDDYSSGGFIAKTTDGGLTWKVLSPEPWHSTNISFPDANAIQFITEQTGFIFTESGEIYKTIDGGNNWKLISKMSFFRLGHFTSEKTGYCVDANNIYDTYNGGKKWNIAYSYPNNGYINIIDMFFLISGEGYAITRDSKIIKINN
jgi:photosystem II stability/assembly factor-like uncharacterized protein